MSSVLYILLSTLSAHSAAPKGTCLTSAQRLTLSNELRSPHISVRIAALKKIAEFRDERLLGYLGQVFKLELAERARLVVETSILGRNEPLEYYSALLNAQEALQRYVSELRFKKKRAEFEERLILEDQQVIRISAYDFNDYVHDWSLATSGIVNGTLGRPFQWKKFLQILHVLDRYLEQDPKRTEELTPSLRPTLRNLFSGGRHLDSALFSLSQNGALNPTFFQPRVSDQLKDLYHALSGIFGNSTTVALQSFDPLFVGNAEMKELWSEFKGMRDAALDQLELELYTELTEGRSPHSNTQFSRDFLARAECLLGILHPSEEIIEALLQRKLYTIGAENLLRTFPH